MSATRAPEPLARYLKAAARELDPAAALERYRGAMLGLAVGNALGAACEGLVAAEIRRRWPDGVREIDPGERTRVWDDDVAQAIELAECLLEGPLDLDAFLRRLVRWAEENGRGMGGQTRRVLLEARVGATGTDAARAVWERSGRWAAGNGAVMRCAPVALRWRREPVRLIAEAGHSARVTHYDPRCVWTTAAVCAAIARALAGADAAPDELAEGLEGVGAPEEVSAAVRRAAATSNPAGLQLDERSSMAYTVRTMTAGLWAFVHADELESALVRLVNAGGDTDTNGAVAGAILGARFGVSAIPARWIERLPDPDRLSDLAERLLAAQRG